MTHCSMCPTLPGRSSCCLPRSARPASTSTAMSRNGPSSASSRRPPVNNFLGQFNLTTQERRVVVVIILVVFFVVNLLLVWPHFKDWNRITKQLEDMRRTEDTYNRDIQLDLNATNGWRKEVDKLARQEGGSKIDNPVDPQNQLQQTIIQQERK